MATTPSRTDGPTRTAAAWSVEGAESAAKPLMQFESDGETIWVEQNRFVWTGRRHGKPVGTIERGRRYTFVDLDGAPRSTHPTLAAAQHAAAAAGQGSTPTRPSSLPHRRGHNRPLVLASSALIAASTSLLVTAAAVVR